MVINSRQPKPNCLQITISPYIAIISAKLDYQLFQSTTVQPVHLMWSIHMVLFSVLSCFHLDGSCFGSELTLFLPFIPFSYRTVFTMENCIFCNCIKTVIGQVWKIVYIAHAMHASGGSINNIKKIFRNQLYNMRAHTAAKTKSRIWVQKNKSKTVHFDIEKTKWFGCYQSPIASRYAS